MFEGAIAAKFADRFFEKEIFKIIKNRATIAALLMMIPDFGLGGLIYIAVLWNMYSAICKKVGISFSENKGKLIGAGVIVNIIVAIIIDIGLTAFFFLEPFIIYAQFYLSGKFFVESLKKCKHCGEWLVDHQQSPQHTSKLETQPHADVKIKQSNTKKIILFIVGGIILAFVIWLIINNYQKSDWEKAMEEYNSQPSYTEGATTVEEMPYFGEGQPSPYDGVPDNEYEEYYGNGDRSYPYDPNSSANSWE